MHCGWATYNAATLNTEAFVQLRDKVVGDLLELLLVNGEEAFQVRNLLLEILGDVYERACLENLLATDYDMCVNHFL